MGYIEEIRKVVGSRLLNLAGVAVAVFNERGQILLQQRQNGIWGVPGGFVELGESTEEAGRREVLEESDEFYPITIAYLCKDIKRGLLKADGIESLSVQFFDFDKLPENISPFIKKLIEQNLVSI